MQCFTGYTGELDDPAPPARWRVGGKEWQMVRISVTSCSDNAVSGAAEYEVETSAIVPGWFGMCQTRTFRAAHRYSDFHSLHDVLVCDLPSLPKQPPKRLFNGPQVRQERITGFTHWLGHVAHAVARLSDVPHELCAFLRIIESDTDADDGTMQTRVVKVQALVRGRSARLTLAAGQAAPPPHKEPDILRKTKSAPVPQGDARELAAARLQGHARGRSARRLFGVRPRAATSSSDHASTMDQTRRAAHERGQKLNAVSDNAAALAVEAGQFADLAKQLNSSQANKGWLG